MPAVDLVVESEASSTIRARQVMSAFDVPATEKTSRRWRLDVPIDARAWQIGLIVGPSGAGKSTIARHLFGDAVDRPLSWGAPSVIDDFRDDLSVQQVTGACSAVGFNTIPAWLRPFHVLSNGEQFRASLARRLLEGGDLIVIDEFTSVVDRQVAQIGSHAVQKHIRRQSGRQFVAVTCHYDVIDWLQPDWIIEPAEQRFKWRSVQSRPKINAVVRPVEYSTWRLFAPYHYMSADLNRSARCWGLFIDEQQVAFCGVLPRPISHGRNKGSAIRGISRIVVLPDYQGMGLSFILSESIGSLYRAVGRRFRNYPAHPSYVRSHTRSKRWKMTKRPGTYNGVRSGSTKIAALGSSGRPCAVFEYVGPSADPKIARRILSYWNKPKGRR